MVVDPAGHWPGSGWKNANPTQQAKKSNAINFLTVPTQQATSNWEHFYSAEICSLLKMFPLKDIGKIKVDSVQWTRRKRQNEVDISKEISERNVDKSYLFGSQSI